MTETHSQHIEVPVDFDLSKQPLKFIKPFKGMSKMPADIPQGSSEEFIFVNLVDCFASQKSIQEGLLKDLFYGLEQGNIPREITAAGLQGLRKLGYIFYTDPNGLVMSDTVLANDKDSVWVRYSQKFLDIFV